jgi:hypothetical protein
MKKLFFCILASMLILAAGVMACGCSKDSDCKPKCDSGKYLTGGHCVKSECQYDSNQQCSDGLFCNGQETCDSSKGGCQTAKPVDCSGSDKKVSTCYFDPDKISSTFDSYFFDSQCDETTDKCTTKPANWRTLITHTCSEDCDAECISDSDCSDTIFCASKHTKTRTGDCLAGCTCDYTKYSDPTCIKGSCDAECSADTDCNDGNDHTKDFCNGNCECKHESIPYCGDGIIGAGETCELPGTSDNDNCAQSTSECIGNKIQTRDGFGDCNSACGCVSDAFGDPQCSKECGAACTKDADCDAGETCSSDCACVGNQIPEFGTIAALVALLGAAVAFAVVRK